MTGARTLAFSLLWLAAAGCGSSSRAIVKGKVTFSGQPVTAGSLMFAPQGGEAAAPATAIVQPDGSFNLGTQKDGDGVAIGRHKVLYTPPPPEGAEWLGYGPKPQLTYSPFHGLTPKEPEVEIKPGSHELTIELVRGQP